MGSYLSRFFISEELTYKEMPLSKASEQALQVAGKKILVLDLDETLVHSTFDIDDRYTEHPDVPYDFTLDTEIEKIPIHFEVYKRPYVDIFLNIVSKWYELIIYTASMDTYANGVLDYLDKEKQWFKKRLFRQHCKLVRGTHLKDLYIITHDMKNILIIDNSPAAIRNFPRNSINIKTWISDQNDIELLNLLPFLDSLRFMTDVRKILCRSLHVTHQYSNASLASNRSRNQLDQTATNRQRKANV